MKIILAFDGDKAGEDKTIASVKNILDYKESKLSYFKWLTFLSEKNFKPTIQEITEYCEDEQELEYAIMGRDLTYLIHNGVGPIVHLRGWIEDWNDVQISQEEREKCFPEINEYQKFEMRKKYLLSEYERLTKLGFSGDEEATKKRWPIYNSYLKHIGEKLKITDEDIENARKYPIENLVKVNASGFAKCPFHNERSPSFFTRKNFGYCFGCGYRGDVIDIAMKLNNWSFVEAIKNLNNK